MHVSCPTRLSSLAMQVGGSGGRSPLGEQGGVGEPLGPPRAGPPSNGGGASRQKKRGAFTPLQCSYLRSIYGYLARNNPLNAAS